MSSHNLNFVPLEVLYFNGNVGYVRENNPFFVLEYLFWRAIYFCYYARSLQDIMQNIC